jgi:peroxiredoxin
MCKKYLLLVLPIALLLTSVAAQGAETVPEPLALIQQMEAAMRNFGPGLIDVSQTLPSPFPNSDGKFTIQVKINDPTHYVEIQRGFGQTSTTWADEQSMVAHVSGAPWYMRIVGDHVPLASAISDLFPDLAKPDSWKVPTAEPLLAATKVVRVQYKDAPAWRIDFPVAKAAALAKLIRLHTSPVLASLTIGVADGLPREWVGVKTEDTTWSATYVFKRAPRPYPPVEMRFTPAPHMLEILSSVPGDGTSSVLKGMAPDFTLKSALDGAPVQLSHLRGHSVLLVLQSDQNALETARKFYEDFHGKGLAVLVVATETLVDVRTALPKGGVPFPVLADTDGKVSAPYRAGDADIVLIGKDGAVRASGRLADDLSRFRSLVDAG